MTHAHDRRTIETQFRVCVSRVNIEANIEAAGGKTLYSFPFRRLLWPVPEGLMRSKR